MQDQQYAQITQYIQQARQSGLPVESIRANLLASEWPEPVVMQLLSQQQPITTPRDPHRVRNAVFWIAGPFVVLIATVLLQFVSRFAMAGTESSGLSPSGFSKAVNVLTIIIGIAAVPMMIIGPVVGIVKLSKK